MAWTDARANGDGALAGAYVAYKNMSEWVTAPAVAVEEAVGLDTVACDRDDVGGGGGTEWEGDTAAVRTETDAAGRSRSMAMATGMGNEERGDDGEDKEVVVEMEGCTAALAAAVAADT